MGGSWRLWSLLAVTLSLCAAALLAPSPARAAPVYPEAVVLVAGFNTAAPFTTPDPSCAEKMGSEWGATGGVGDALRAAGMQVFTAPVANAGKAAPAACVPAGSPPLGDGMTINSNGGTQANGVALARFLAFLRDSYGVSEVHLLGHSDGGLWSRSALTENQPYAGLSVVSFTTLGTPHTGSFVADLTEELHGGKCNFSNRVEQLICDAMSGVIEIVVDKLGPEATRQLTSDFLTTWNPQQTIGACPVNGIAGDRVGFPLSGLDYYTPNDGLVGEASALAEAATDINGHPIPAPEIPDFRVAGIYDVVHGAAVKIIDKQNLLNTPAISAKVVETMTSGAENCNIAAPAAAGQAVGSEVAGAAAEQERVRLRAPLYRLVPADRRGRLPGAGPEDFVLGKRGVTIRCGFDVLDPIPMLGDERLRVHAPAGCEERLRARAGGSKQRPARALLLRAHRHRDLLATVDGDDLQINVRGRDDVRVTARALLDGVWRRLELDREGRAELPASGPELALRVRAHRRGSAGVADSAHISLAR